MVTKVGNLKLYCNGKIFVGPDWKSLMKRWQVVLCLVLYLAFIAIKMGPDVFWLGFLLILFNLTILGFTGLSNPSVIPRGPTPSDHDPAPLTRTKDYQINGYTVSTKYCTSCQIYRVPRCSHCSMTDNYVEKFDHYCPWVGTCIGRRNYRFFLMFVFSGTFLFLMVWSFSLSRLVQVSDSNDDEFDTALKNEPVAIALVIYTFAAVWFLGGLSVFHTYLVLTNQTTYEHTRRRFGQHGNPYNKGVFMNLFEACCQLNPPYDWEDDGSQIQTNYSSSRTLELPSGVVFNPTVIAMQQPVKEQAERAKKAHSRRGSEVGSSSQATADVRSLNIIKDFGSTPVEYQDSLYSSCASVEARQMGITGQIASTGVSPFLAESSTSETKEVESAQPKEEEGNESDEISTTSLENLTPFGQETDESGLQSTSIRTSLDSVNQIPRRRSQHHSHGKDHAKEDTMRKKSGRNSDSELSAVRGATKRSTSSFASYADEAGDTDSNPLEVATTWSSLTSNATSEVSTYRIDRHRKTEHTVMSMEEIMSSHRSFSELSLPKQLSKRNTGVLSKNTLCASDDLSKMTSWRKSGENMIKNIRAFVKRPSHRSSGEKTDAISTVDQVIVEVSETRDIDDDDETKDTESSSDAHQNVTTGKEKTGHKTWRTQLPVITQKKYEELKDTSGTPETRRPKSISEDAVSHERFTSIPTVITAQNVLSNEITPDVRLPKECPPDRIDVLKLTEESSSVEKDSDPKLLL